MATLDRIMQLQQQGMSDQEIIKQLRNEGVNPTQINDALNQAKVKSAVGYQEDQTPQNPMSEMQPSEQNIQQQPQTQEYQPTQEPQQEYQQTPQYQEQAQAYQDQYYPQASQYPDQQTYQQQSMSTDTITEIAEQVIMEKFAEFNKKTGNLITFKNETLDKINDLNERLKLIENTINNLQQSIIKKVGEFSENISSINQDLHTLNNTTSKLMNPLIDNARELERITGKDLVKKRGRPKSN